jgi:hypothetical protein
MRINTRRVTARSTIGALAALGMLVGAAGIANAALVPPERIEQRGQNVDPCPGGTIRLQEDDQEGQKGDFTLSKDGVSVDYTVGKAPEGDPGSAITVFTATGGVVRLVEVMDGTDGGNVYTYNPGVVKDTMLTTPGPDQGPYTFKQISNIDFCVEKTDTPFELDGDLGVTKDVDAKYDRTVTWEHTKDVNGKASESFSGAPGQTFEWNWNLTWTKNDSGPENHRVNGTITVTNSLNLPVDLDTLTDELQKIVDDEAQGAGTATINCGTEEEPAAFAPQQLAEDGTLTCTYSVDPADPTATQNRVDVAGSVTIPAGFSNSGEVVPQSDSSVVPFTYFENLTGSDTAQLVDEYLEIDEEVSASGSRTIPDSYTCPAFGAPEYEGDNRHDVTIVNESSLTPTGGAAIEASAEVTVTCVQAVQRPSISIQNGAPAPIRSVSNGVATWTGSFIIYNASGGDQTVVTLGATDVLLERTVRGVKTPLACQSVELSNGGVIQPNGSIVASYTCTNGWTNGGQYKAGIKVENMTNQLGEVRNGPPRTWSNSRTY